MMRARQRPIAEDRNFALSVKVSQLRMMTKRKMLSQTSRSNEPYSLLCIAYGLFELEIRRDLPNSLDCLPSVLIGRYYHRHGQGGS